MYEEVDIARAYFYMKRAMEDAAFCNARLRTIEVSQVLPIINEAYRLQRERQQRQMFIYLLCISVSVSYTHLLYKCKYFFRIKMELSLYFLIFRT